jgi:hypothetical protein
MPSKKKDTSKDSPITFDELKRRAEKLKREGRMPSLGELQAALEQIVAEDPSLRAELEDAFNEARESDSES